MIKKTISMVCAFALLFSIMSPVVTARSSGNVTIDGNFGEWQNVRKTLVTWWDDDWEGNPNIPTQPTSPENGLWEDYWWSDKWWDNDSWWNDDNDNNKNQKYLCAMTRDGQNIYVYVGLVEKNKGNGNREKIPNSNYQFYIDKKYCKPEIQMGKIAGGVVTPLRGRNVFPDIGQIGITNYVTTTQDWVNTVEGLSNGGYPSIGAASLKNGADTMWGSSNFPSFKVVSQLEFSVNISDFEKYLKPQYSSTPITPGSINRGAMVAMFNHEMGIPALIMAGTPSGIAVGLSLSVAIVSAGFIANKKRGKNKKKDNG